MPFPAASRSSAHRPRPESTAVPRRRLRSAGAWAAAGVVVVALGFTTGSAAAVTPGAHPVAGDPVGMAALTSARELADRHPETSVIPPTVVEDLGYAPIVENALAAKATGDCSTPVPLPAAFEPACRVHDLGYDLLRVAHRHGAAIPDGLRSDLDTLLGRQLRESCEGDPACTIMADIAHVAVGLNTVRQGHGAPVEESLPW